MSVDMHGNLDTPAEEPKKKVARKAKVRKFLLTTVYKNEIAEKLNKLDAAGHSLVTIIPSSDIRGFEIITVFEE
jgi:hypothetical protein